MRLKVLDDAIREAERFLEAVRVAKTMAGHSSYAGPDGKYLNPGQYTAAVRRASMDLTRSLVAVRRGH